MASDRWTPEHDAALAAKLRRIRENDADGFGSRMVGFAWQDIEALHAAHHRAVTAVERLHVLLVDAREYVGIAHAAGGGDHSGPLLVDIDAALAEFAAPACAACEAPFGCEPGRCMREVSDVDG